MILLSRQTHCFREFSKYQYFVAIKVSCLICNGRAGWYICSYRRHSYQPEGERIDPAGKRNDSDHCSRLCLSALSPCSPSPSLNPLTHRGTTTWVCPRASYTGESCWIPLDLPPPLHTTDTKRLSHWSVSCLASFLPLNPVDMGFFRRWDGSVGKERAE